MEGTETLCPHATTSNHRRSQGTCSQLLSLKPMHGEWLSMQNPRAKFHWRFLLKSEMIGAPELTTNVITRYVSVPSIKETGLHM